MSYEYVQVERHGHVMVIGINRPKKANSFNLQLCRELSSAYAELDADDSIRVGVLHGVGRHFTAGMDLREVGPEVSRGSSLLAPGGIHPWMVEGKRLSKPLIAAVHGKCLTLGVELVLAADIVVCAASASFAQLEPLLGLFPFGGVTVRLPQRAGWGNAMRWILTCEEYDAREAYRLGLVQEVVDDGDHLTRAMQLAEKIARQAPLAIKAVLENSRRALREGEAAAELEMPRLAQQTFNSEDGQAGIDTFRQPVSAPVFVGR
ncbi:crotonase/enoyl-CoA hydratase family protein [Saccharopolyspora mangrovi]|uniref:Crotonase/enoyl-CoA hydratase family protein n=1 Tax=Saccharopolyspora mangrovi TaxID=3082379 RepID=A0ABU6AIH1_9PSEU|nr:crotonase/enoyl-CoA hydratase family protein [Saccharopolyspora sp. S2-29]MEB3371363.1 crotonase/enoyl-CoA hydratase family protein [Saccharopolyspora sp. S2-29]